MKALTLTQPWAGLVASGIKRVENRRRSMGAQQMLGERIAIHASREIDDDVFDRIAELAPDLTDAGIIWRDAAKHGNPEWMRLAEVTSAVIAVATIDKVLAPNWTAESIHEHRDVISYSDGTPIGPSQVRWFFGPVGILLRDIKALSRPVSCKGSLGLWRLPEGIEVEVMDQVINGGAS